MRRQRHLLPLMESRISKMNAVLYHGDASVLEGIEEALAADHIEIRGPDSVGGAYSEKPSVFVLDAVMAGRSSRLDELLGKLPEHVVVVAADEDVEATAKSSRVMLTLPRSGKPDARLRVLRAAYQLSGARLSAARAERELARSRNELSQLHRIGMALM